VIYPATATIPTSTTYYVTSSTTSSSSQVFNYTGSVQTWTVPAGVTQVTIDAYGAQGFSAGGGLPGLGGRIQAIQTVTPGQVLSIYVVGSGTSNTGGGWNGGGSTSGNYTQQGRGGGASDVRAGGTALSNRIIVAGGGGGAGYNWGSNPNDNAGHGGGSTGGRNNSCPVAGAPGYGGTQSAGGPGGVYSGWASGVAGILGDGGAGASGTGGGGGGGYYGGGGGSWSGGGGGSSFSSGSILLNQQGVRSGNGQIILSWNGTGCTSSLVPVSITVNAATTPTASGVSISCGQTATLSASSNASLTWYANSNGKGQLGTGSSFTTPTLTTSTTYYVQGESGSCATSIVAVPVTVNTNIAAPTVSNLTIGCGQTAALTASGATAPYTYMWYSNSAGTTQIGSGANYTSPALTNNTTYYVAQGTPGSGTQTFNYTGSVQTFTAPLTGTYTLDLYGAPVRRTMLSM
jgi:hypothetical protein